MLDKNNLKRIKGILSARLGTEISKFQNPGGPLNISTIPEMQKIIDNVNLTIALQNTLNELNNDPEIWWYRNVERKDILDPITITDNRIPSESSIESSVDKKIEKKVEEKVEEEVEKSRKERRQDRIARKEAEWGGKDIRNLGIYNMTQGISTGIQSIGNIFGEQQSVTDSQLTRNIDTAYNGISSAVSNMGPAGKVVGMAMDTLGAIGNISQAIGGGTDLQTKLDSWMDSPLLSWNVGAINGFFGKNTDSFGVDLETLQQVGGSYGGITTSINEAAESADKEYGLFSGKARKKANDAINKAKQLQNSMGNIANQASDQKLAVQSMGEQAGLAYSMMTNGGYDLKYTYAAKQGGVINWEPNLSLNWEPKIKFNLELPEFKEGGFLEKIDWTPKLQTGGKTRTLEELIEYAKKENPRFIQRFSEEPRGIEFTDDEGNKQHGSHLLGWELDENGNAIVFPSIQEMENGELKLLSILDAYDRAIENNNYLKMTPEEAKLFTESGEDENGNLFGYKIGWPDFFKNSQKNDYTEKYPQEYLKFKESLPDNHKYTPENEYRMYKYWQLWGKPENFEYTLNNPNEDGDYMFNWDTSDSSYHGSTIAWGDDGVGYFIKPKHHDTILYELDYYNDGTITKEGGKLRKPNKKERASWEEFRRNYILEDDGDFYKYVPVKQILQDLEISQQKYLKEGGSLGDKDIPEIEETTQKNVIPEGALHKNKHHMEHAEGLTKKGIPVIDEEGEQQAEIEHSEIIFTLEVTKKLEEYYQIFYSEESSNKEKEQAALDAGKLLVYQILENTEDRTGLIESCKKGGTLNIKESNKNFEKELIKKAFKEVLIELLTK